MTIECKCYHNSLGNPISLPPECEWYKLFPTCTYHYLIRMWATLHVLLSFTLNPHATVGEWHCISICHAASYYNREWVELWFPSARQLHHTWSSACQLHYLIFMQSFIHWAVVCKWYCTFGGCLTSNNQFVSDTVYFSPGSLIVSHLLMNRL